MVGEIRSRDGVAVRYDVVGRGTPAFVLVHGWSCDRRYWRYQTAHFAERGTVVAVDLAGYAESGSGRAAWTMQAFGDDAVAVLDALDLRDAVLVHLIRSWAGTSVLCNWPQLALGPRVVVHPIALTVASGASRGAGGRAVAGGAHAVIGVELVLLLLGQFAVGLDLRGPRMLRGPVQLAPVRAADRRR